MRGRHARSPVLGACRQARWVTSLPIDEPKRSRGGPRAPLSHQDALRPGVLVDQFAADLRSQRGGDPGPVLGW